MAWTVSELAPYAWIITSVTPHGGCPESERGTIGPSRAPNFLICETRRRKAQAFRMLDDDGIIYYYGRIAGTFDGFEPLEDFGTPNAGCTSIQLYDRDKKEWNTL